MQNKYYNDAIIGNKKMIASYSEKGELLRVLYPNTDYRQFINEFFTGLKINDSSMIYLHKDVNNVYEQYYEENTNILHTKIKNTYFNFKIEQIDFVSINNDVLIKKYKFKNENIINLDVNFLVHSNLISTVNNPVSGLYKNNALIQYMHDYSFYIISKNKINKKQINNSKNDISSGNIDGKDYVGMSADSSIDYNIGTIKPGEEKEIEILISINKTEEKENHSKIEENIENIRKIDVKKELETTRKYWKKYVKEHTDINLELKDKFDEQIRKIYTRTILLYPLLINEKTGGISAAIEVDENKTKSGGYAFCWPRDAIFITKAFDILKMEKETENFYKNFCKNTQSKSGLWEQRFYTDGSLAPSWGYQIDETASVVYGVYEHYKNSKEIKFLKDNLKMCEKAVNFLKKYINDIFKNEEKIKKSYDIWEENEGIHTYSLTSIFSAFECLIKIYEIVKPTFAENRLKLEQINKEKLELEKIQLEIKEYIINNFYDTNKKTFIRNKDGKIDISLLGLVTPFKMFTAKDKKILNTVEKMNLTLRTYTGGYLRYEDDKYLDGNNPWVISNLWLANYYLEKGERSKAKECFKFVVNTSTKHGFLAEQIDNKTMKSKWVIGLGWSHALFIIVLKNLLSK